MTIHFYLAWIKPGSSSLKGFKLNGAKELFYDYLDRISKFVSVKTSGFSPNDYKKKSSIVWLCERAQEAKAFTSEQIAKEVDRACHSGLSEIQIIIGGPDGFTKTQIDHIKPDVKWSFGPLTLMHEIAAVVAAEQVYRSWTILRQLPYHLGHS